MSQINQSTIDIINRGEIHIVEPELNTFVYSAVKSGYLVANIEPVEADIFIIAVPTPFHADKFNKITNSPIPNIDYIVDATKKIAPYVKLGNSIILESTSPVGTTNMVAEILNKEGGPQRVLPHPYKGLLDSNILNFQLNKKSGCFWGP